MSSGADIQARFRKFLESSPDNQQVYESLRSGIIDAIWFRPYSDELGRIESLLEAGQVRASRERLDRCMLNFLLSPKAHRLSARIALLEFDQSLADLESEAAEACLAAIAASGDGTRARPFHVLQASDEYDLLEHLNLTMSAQELVHENGRYFDVLTCGANRIWFDITDAYVRLQEFVDE